MSYILDIYTEVVLVISVAVFLYGGYMSFDYYNKIPKSPFSKIIKNLGAALYVGGVFQAFWVVYLLTDRAFIMLGWAIGFFATLFFIIYLVAVAISLRDTLKTIEDMTT